MTHPTRRRLRPVLLALACAGLSLAGLALPASAAGPPPVAAGPAAGARRWSLAAEPVAAEGGLLALATAPGGALAAGDARGLLLPAAPGPGSGWVRIPLRGAVHDLAFAADGALWVASEEGLFRFAGERLAARPPAPGEAARAVLRVASRGRLLAVATRDGVHWSRDGQRFARVEGSFGEAEPPRPDEAEAGEAPPSVHGIALAPPEAPGDAALLWIAAERGVFRARLAGRDGAARVLATSVATPVLLRPALDVSAAADGVLVLGRDALLAGDAAGRRWSVYRPELPPGALPVRLLAAPGGLWIATGRGVVEAERPDGPWRRAGEPAGSKPAFALAVREGELLVASAVGLLVGGAPGVGGTAASAPAAAPRTGSACDPPIAAVQRAALAHLDLTGARTARMWRGVRRRGALPAVSLDGALVDDSRHYRTWDESFTSGQMHRLFDRDRDREKERALALRLTWELGDLLYHPEEIDVSTEMRRTIELRDDVLDELNQLYFDRRRARDAAAAAGAGTPEAAREALRAEELAAGIDAWTGGWFGPRAGASVCPPGDR
ncbi:MAG: hypothetical protein OZ948_08750 [Deltaproteobacteria bacterium]|nr:hypothetical protein [Deltaproteobacteria bacterium]